MSQTEKLGVMLFNLGGPEKQEDVKPFLYNLFCDAEIIKLPWSGLQKPLAWFISTFRHKKSAALYAKIGGGSPLRRITDEQAAALKAELARRGVKANTYVAMRCWKPSTEEALDAVMRDGITRLVALPLYPQFSISTTRSSFRYLIKLFRQRGGLRNIKRHYISDYCDNPRYITALVETINAALKNLPDQNPQATHILFSAHSIPESYLEQGEPYLKHTERTVAAVKDLLGQDRPYTLAFQSKVGRAKWLEPSTDTKIRELGKKGVKQLLVVPISFVSEHSETLYELDILYKEVADEVGISHFTRAAALNLNANFIGALADLVQEKLASTKPNKIKVAKGDNR